MSRGSQAAMGDEALIHNYIVEHQLGGRLLERIVLWDETQRAGLAAPPEHETKFLRYSLEPPKELGTAFR